MRLPEQVRSVGSDALVEPVVRLGSVEGRVLSQHDEQDDRGSKHVGCWSRVWLPLMDFWSHIIQCSESSSEETGVLLAVSWSGKAEVCDFNVELGVQEDVFRL